jgi:hypothetical protein
LLRETVAAVGLFAAIRTRVVVLHVTVITFFVAISLNNAVVIALCQALCTAAVLVLWCADEGSARAEISHDASMIALAGAVRRQWLLTRLAIWPLEAHPSIIAFFALRGIDDAIAADSSRAIIAAAIVVIGIPIITLFHRRAQAERKEIADPS